MPSPDPEDLTPVQQLLRLKRYETPGEDFTEDLLRAMHQRQRAELLKSSALTLAWERARTYWSESSAPRWATAAAACLVLAGWTLLPSASVEGESVATLAMDGETLAEGALAGGLDNALAVDAVMIMGMEPSEVAEEGPMLLSRHFSGGYADDAREVKTVVTGALRDEAVTELE